MSSFVVDAKTINGIVSHLFKDKDAAHVRHQLPVAMGTPAQLGEAMYKLNLAAVEDRYGDFAAGEMSDLDYTFRPVHASKVQVVKSLSCWLYQCAEGVIDQDPLYKLMADYRGELAMDFVRALPEWEKSNWG